MKQSKAITRRTAVFVAMSNTVGHELVFRHYTSKVVVGKHPETTTIKSSERRKQQKIKPTNRNRTRI